MMPDKNFIKLIISGIVGSAIFLILVTYAMKEITGEGLTVYGVITAFIIAVVPSTLLYLKGYNPSFPKIVLSVFFADLIAVKGVEVAVAISVISRNCRNFGIGFGLFCAFAGIWGAYFGAKRGYFALWKSDDWSDDWPKKDKYHRKPFSGEKEWSQIALIILIIVMIFSMISIFMREVKEGAEVHRKREDAKRDIVNMMLKSRTIEELQSSKELYEKLGDTQKVEKIEREIKRRESINAR